MPRDTLDKSYLSLYLTPLSIKKPEIRKEKEVSRHPETRESE